MLFHTLTLLLFSISPALISSLQCIECNKNIVVNYTVTSETIPSFAHCQYNITVFQQCLVHVTWDLINNSTTLWVSGIYATSTKTIVTDSDDLDAGAILRVSPDQKTLSLEHFLDYDCSSDDNCNNETNLKRLLRSVTIKTQFLQEITPILKVVSSFDPESAGCFASDNVTAFLECNKQDLKKCKRCAGAIISAIPSGVQVCQTCPEGGYNTNLAMRFISFQLSARKVTYDIADCGCQLNKCNSIDNINRIYKASQITFDFDKFYYNSSNIIAKPLK